MKGMCSVASGEACTFIVHGKEQPEVGGYYYLESAKSGTQEQNKAFHALVGEYYKSGLHKYDTVSYAEFKDLIKRDLGAKFEAFIYVEMEKYNYDGYGGVIEQGERPVIKDAQTYEDIPEHIRQDPELKSLARGRLKSWSKYTKKERTSTIDKLISEMLQVGVDTKKFHEIIEGMGGDI